MAIEILLNDKTVFIPQEEDIAKWQESYPSVKVQEELKKIDSWSRSNPANRKTRKGVKRFVNNWLARQHDKTSHNPEFKTARRPQPLSSEYYVHAEVLDRLCEARLDHTHYRAESNVTFRFPLEPLIDQAIDLVERKAVPKTPMGVDEDKKKQWMDRYYRSYVFGTAHRKLRKAWDNAA